MPGFFGEGSGPQPPRILRSVAEQATLFEQLREQNTPLTLTFGEHSQRFLTYISAIDRNAGQLALDELVPAEGQRLLERGEPFRILAYLDGIQIVWASDLTPVISQHQGYKVAWLNFPEQLVYHQKRGAYRVRTLASEPLQLSLAGAGTEPPLPGQVVDLSATGCRVRLEQPAPTLQAGQALEHCTLHLPDGPVVLSSEIRHITCTPGSCLLGLRFLRPAGMAQRSIERYVNHLQRETRRRQAGELF